MIGIIVLNFIAYEETIKCVRSIMKACQEDFKIYIVDNASPNESYLRIKEYFLSNDQVIVIQNTRNVGYAAGNNIGIKKALEEGCQYILIANSDIIFHDHSITILRLFLENNPQVGIVGPKVLHPSGEVEHKSRMFMKTGIKEKIFARTKFRSFNIGGMYRRYYGLDRSFNEVTEVFALLGCCFMFSRNMAEQITPLDENTFLYEEEVIIGIRAAATGLKTFYVPDSVVTHVHAMSSKYIGAFSLIHLVNSEIYYCKTYLKACIIQILLVYMVRFLLYLSRCLHDKNYRKNLKEFFFQTQYRLWSKDGLGNYK